jgi:hypothetical protein
MTREEIDAQVAKWMADPSIWATPEQIVEYKRKQAEQRKAKARAAKRWGPLPTIVLVQNAKQAEAALLERLEREPEFVGPVWLDSYAYHVRLTKLKARHVR